MFKIRKGSNRWNDAFIKNRESKNHELSKETVDSREKALVGGYEENKPNEDRDWQNSVFSLPTKRMKNRSDKKRVIRNNDLERDIAEQEERLYSHKAGGVGGMNQDQKKLEKDKKITQIVKTDDKVEAKPRNEWNTNEDAGAYTGGKKRAEFLKKNKLLEI